MSHRLRVILLLNTDCTDDLDASWIKGTGGNSSMKFYDISLPIIEGMIVYPDNPKP